MAAACAHSVNLKSTLKPCHDESSLIASAHKSYVKIIDDLKNDLDKISCEVIMVHRENSDQDQCHQMEDVGFENLLKELETQNDRLERALKLETQHKQAAFTELQTNIAGLKCQIDHLQRTLFEREQHIIQLTGMIKNISGIQSTQSPNRAALEYVTSRNNFTTELEKKIEDLSHKLEKSTQQEHFLHRETRKLNEELNESKQKNGDLISQAHRLGNLLKTQENHRMELAAKYEALEQNYEDQAKKLRIANNQLCMLHERFQTMEKRQNEHNMENNLLRDEVLSLKEKHACAIGRQKSIEEQLLKAEKELYTAHDVINEQKTIMQRKEFDQNESLHRLQEANAELKGKLSDLVQEFKKLQDEHDKQKRINLQQLKLLDNFRKWKEQQHKAEQATRDYLKYYENVLHSMIEEKQKHTEKYHNLCKEYSLLQNELDRLKVCSLSLPNTSERSIFERLEIIRRTTQRVAEQSSSLKSEEATALKYGDSSTAFKANAEPL